MGSAVLVVRTLGATVQPSASPTSTTKECSKQVASITCRYWTRRAGLSTTVAIMSVLIRPMLLERTMPAASGGLRSEEHTSELQSHSDLVCRLLLEKKKKKNKKEQTL